MDYGTIIQTGVAIGLFVLGLLHGTLSKKFDKGEQRFEAIEKASADNRNALTQLEEHMKGQDRIIDGHTNTVAKMIQTTGSLEADVRVVKGVTEHMEKSLTALQTTMVGFRAKE